MLKSCDTVLFI